MRAEDLVDTTSVQALCAPSIDEFNLTMRGAAWDIDFVQIERGAKPVDAFACASASVSLLRVEFRNRIHQQGNPPSGKLTFGIPAQIDGSFRFGAREEPFESILGFSGTTGFDCISDRGHKAYTLSFISERLTESARILGQPAIEEMTVNRGAVRHPDPAKLTALRRGLATLFQGAGQRQAARAMPAFAAAIESELPLIFLQCWNEASSPGQVPAKNRSRVVTRARDYIDAHAKEAITVADVCRAASCSLSTLGRAFRAHFGVSPKLYLTAVRLAGVRRSLLTSGEPVGVAAAEWGFWHFSKFAQDYKRMYRELPSATRSRVAGVRSGQ
jgi:AraC family ethanolamine operon transcriptional activator